MTSSQCSPASDDPFFMLRRFLLQAPNPPGSDQAEGASSGEEEAASDRGDGAEADAPAGDNKPEERPQVPPALARSSIARDRREDIV